MKFPQQDCLELNGHEAVSVRTRVKQIFLLKSIYFLQFVESGTNCEFRLRKWGNNSRNPCHLLRRRSSNSKAVFTSYHCDASPNLRSYGNGRVQHWFSKNRSPYRGTERLSLVSASSKPGHDKITMRARQGLAQTAADLSPHSRAVSAAIRCDVVGLRNEGPDVGKAERHP
jgi:hypothetical protein